MIKKIVIKKPENQLEKIKRECIKYYGKKVFKERNG